MPVSSKSTQNLLPALIDRLNTVESVNTGQENLITNNTTVIGNNTLDITSAADFFNNAGYQTAANVNTAIAAIKGNPPALLDTLEKLVLTISYRGQAPYPYALVKGVRWDEEDSNGQLLEKWFWNGNYWLSTEKLASTVSAFNISANSHTQFCVPQVADVNTNIFFLNLKTDFIQASNPDTNSFWRMTVYSITNAGVFNLINDFADRLQTFTPNVVNRSFLNLNVHFDMASTNTCFFRFTAFKSNSAVNLTCTSLLTYRKARI